METVMKDIDIEAERVLFEADAEQGGFSLHRLSRSDGNVCNQYMDTPTSYLWQGWLARAAIENERHQRIEAAAIALIERWETPLWKDVPHTGNYIHALRDALQSKS